VNAVSEWFSVEVSREVSAHMEFERGKTTKNSNHRKAKGTGTLVTFKPDPEIFVKQSSSKRIGSRSVFASWHF